MFLFLHFCCPAPILFGVFTVAHFTGAYLVVYKQTPKVTRVSRQRSISKAPKGHFPLSLSLQLKIEDQSARRAVEPVLLAERDREYLRQLRKNRDKEADLMKNVAGWEVGTYFGSPIFKTLPKDT